MIAPHFVPLGALLSVIGCSFYIRAVLTGATRPNKVSWFMWGAMPIIAFVAQLDEGVGLPAVLTLSVGLGPALVFAASFVNRNSYSRINTLDVICGVVSLGAVATWLLLDSPTMAVVMIVVADTVAAIPTIVKSWVAPNTERTSYYALAAANGVIAILTLDSWRLVDWLFPVYITAVATTIALTVTVRRCSLIEPDHTPPDWTAATTSRRSRLV